MPCFRIIFLTGATSDVFGFLPKFFAARTRLSRNVIAGNVSEERKYAFAFGESDGSGVCFTFETAVDNCFASGAQGCLNIMR